MTIKVTVKLKMIKNIQQEPLSTYMADVILVQQIEGIVRPKNLQGVYFFEFYAVNSPSLRGVYIHRICKQDTVKLFFFDLDTYKSMDVTDIPSEHAILGIIHTLGQVNDFLVVYDNHIIHVKPDNTKVELKMQQKTKIIKAFMIDEKGFVVISREKDIVHAQVFKISDYSETARFVIPNARHVVTSFTLFTTDTNDAVLVYEQENCNFYTFSLTSGEYHKIKLAYGSLFEVSQSCHPGCFGFKINRNTKLCKISDDGVNVEIISQEDLPDNYEVVCFEPGMKLVRNYTDLKIIENFSFFQDTKPALH